MLRLLLLLGLLLAAPLQAATPTSLSESIAALEKELTSPSAKTALEPGLLERARTRLEAIQQERLRLQAAEARLSAAQQLERQGPGELARLQAKQRETFPLPDLQGLTPARLNTLLEQTQADEQAAKERLELAQQGMREAELRGQTLRLASLKPVQEPPISPPAANEPPLLVRAQQLLTQVRQQTQQTESQALALEQATQPLAMQLAQARLQLAQLELDRLRSKREKLEEVLQAQRLAEAEAAGLLAGQAAEKERHPALKRLAEANQAWADRLAAMTQRLSELNRQRDDLTRRTEAMRQDMSTLRQRIDQLGLSPVIGNLLLQKRSELPTSAELKRLIKANRALVGEIQLLDLDIATERNALSHRETLLAPLLEEETPAAERAALEPSLQRLLQAREDILQRLEGLQPPLLLAVNDVELALETQRRTVQEFNEFIAQNLLWMPNARPLWSTAWADYEKSLLALFDLRRAYADVKQAFATLAAAPAANLATLLVIGGLLALRPRLRRHIRQAADLPIQQAAPWTPLIALGLVLLYALPWPLLAWFVGNRLMTESPNGSFAQGLGQALTTLAPLLLYARAALALFHPKGLAERHFGWHPETLQALRQTMHLFIAGVLPFGFFAALAMGLDTEPLRDGVGRLAFMLALMGLAFMFGRLLHPKGGIMHRWRETYPQALSARLAPLWFLLGVGLPLSFAALAAIGYFYSASLLTEKLITSLWLALGLWVFYDFGLRFLQLARQRIERRRQQETASAKREAEFDGTSPSELDVEQISQQSRKLLNFSLGLALLFALYTVWSPILPALHVFEHITLWQYHGQIKGETVAVNVSLGDLLLAGLGLLAMWVAAKNLPGLMEIILERWTGYDPGTRYAIITISRYVIIAVGLILILGRLGLQWSQMQWLVAALGVGLGFGLQEIFANFISGLIILFERPVRVGDLVSIGDKTGHIKKIHIRATVLEDFDRKEIIIPNKKLITEQVTNWTLSDTSTRVVVDVGVAYGSDPREVAEVLRTAAGRVPGLIQDPPPGVWFMGFGDSALNFRLRAFVENAEARTDTISELHYAIEQALREKGISIPFPQRDIHIKDIQGLPKGLFAEKHAP